MANNFNESFMANLIGLWDFRSGNETADTGLDDGIAQNGHFEGGASASGDQLHTDGDHDYFDVSGDDDPFDLGKGTIVVEFTQDNHVGSSPDTLVNRGEYDDRGDEGYFELRVTHDGRVEVMHCANGEDSILRTQHNFFNEGDTVKAYYVWDETTGNKLVVENLTQGTETTVESTTTGLTMDIGDDDDESFTFAARETDDGEYSRFFDGQIDYVAILDDDITVGPALDGVVEGTSAGDLIDINYTGDPEGDMVDNSDSLIPPGTNQDVIDAFGGNDTVLAGEDDDTVYAGSGDDSVEGGDGDDVIFGDSNLDPTGGGTVRESFEWDQAPDPNSGGAIDDGDPLTSSFTQNTGNVDVTYTLLSADGGVETTFSDEDQNVSGIVDDGSGVDDESSLWSINNGSGNDSAYQLEFSDEVENVSFRVNDIDGDGVVRIKAYDAAGNPIEVSLTAGSGLTLLDTDSVAGNDTADSNGGYDDADTSTYSLLVSIPGPVDKIVIEHEQNGPNNTGVHITDVYFDVPLGDTGPDGDDTLNGGDGEDMIFGEGGDDELSGGADDDTVDGGDGNDDISGDEGDDDLSGGDGDDTVDGGDGDDTITGGDGANELIGGDGNDDITGGDDGELINAGVEGSPDRGFPATPITPELLPDSDPFDDRDTVVAGGGDDTITTGDDNDSVDAGDGDDEVDGGFDDDTIDGGDGDDLLVGGEGSDSLLGGDGDDTIYGGLDPSFPDVLNVTDDGSDGNPIGPDPVTDNGRDFIDGGDGDDVIFGQDDDDTIEGGAGDDTIDAGIDDDLVSGGTGDDSIMGGQGDDTLSGDEGDDRIMGDAGDDSITGGAGSDTVIDNEGNNIIDTSDPDTLNALPDRGFPFVANSDDQDPENDRDVVVTGDGDDTITTGDDRDTISAGNGDNVIDAGFDDDTVVTGSGDDLITLGEGSDTVNAGDGDDTIFGGLGPSFPDIVNIPDDNDAGPDDPILDNGDDLIDAGAGNDLVFGEDDNDTIRGGAGDDTLDGGIDDDTIRGGDDDDEIIGGQGADRMFGDDDRDTFIVDDGTHGGGDYIEGGEGGDDFDQLDLTGAGPLRVTFDDSIDPGGTPGESGTVTFYDGNGFGPGNVTGTLTFKEIENVIPCFTPGTRIATPTGEVPVEGLKEGDKVITRDNGIQEIRWIGNRTLQRDELRRAPYLRPILIKAGSLGEGLPERDMLVSPQHRMLVSGDATQLYFEESEVLVAAKHLVNHRSVQWLDPLRVSYVHFMFDRHEVVLADGAWTESFQPGDQTLGAMGNGARNEILEIFPELRTPDGRDSYVAARRALKAHEARLIAR